MIFDWLLRKIAPECLPDAAAALAAAIPPPKAPDGAGGADKGLSDAAYDEVIAVDMGAPWSCMRPCDCGSVPGDVCECAYKEAKEAVRQLIRFIGDDPMRDGLLDTPARVLKAWSEDWGKGYRSPAPKMRAFPETIPGNADQMVVIAGIDFHSTCEHHLAPFYGTCDVGYIPMKNGAGKVSLIGLSKFARVVEHYSRRLQVQERLTAQIADRLLEISPDVAIIMRASHMCMVSRGVQKAGSITTTSAMRGRFLSNASAKEEFIRLSRAGISTT